MAGLSTRVQYAEGRQRSTVTGHGTEGEVTPRQRVMPPDRCRLLVGPEAWALQALLMGLALVSLLIKRCA